MERRGNEILRVLNGAAKLAHGNSREVHAEAAVLVDPDGHVQNFVHTAAVVRARGSLSLESVLAGDARPVPLIAPVASRAAEAGLRDPSVERALRIIGRDDVDYRDLYYVFEIAQAALGSDMFSDDGVTRAEVRRFTHTAQSPSALGDQARHGTEKTMPPVTPMPFPEAEALIHRIVRLWLRL